MTNSDPSQSNRSGSPSNNHQISTAIHPEACVSAQMPQDGEGEVTAGSNMPSSSQVVASLQFVLSSSSLSLPVNTTHQNATNAPVDNVAPVSTVVLRPLPNDIIQTEDPIKDAAWPGNKAYAAWIEAFQSFFLAGDPAESERLQRMLQSKKPPGRFLKRSLSDASSSSSASWELLTQAQVLMRLGQDFQTRGPQNQQGEIFPQVRSQEVTPTSTRTAGSDLRKSPTPPAAVAFPTGDKPKEGKRKKRVGKRFAEVLAHPATPRMVKDLPITYEKNSGTSVKHNLQRKRVSLPLMGRQEKKPRLALPMVKLPMVEPQEQKPQLNQDANDTLKPYADYDYRDGSNNDEEERANDPVEMSDREEEDTDDESVGAFFKKPSAVVAVASSFTTAPASIGEKKPPHKQPFKRIPGLHEELPKGITQRPSGKWQAQIYFAGFSRYVGVFKTVEEAAMAFRVTMRELEPYRRQKLTKEEAVKIHNEARDKGFEAAMAINIK